jgi:hypothetical protein
VVAAEEKELVVAATKKLKNKRNDSTKNLSTLGRFFDGALACFAGFGYDRTIR